MFGLCIRLGISEQLVTEVTLLKGRRGLFLIYTGCSSARDKVALWNQLLKVQQKALRLIRNWPRCLCNKFLISVK